jgi:hypothetical protein
MTCPVRLGIRVLPRVCLVIGLSAFSIVQASEGVDFDDLLEMASVPEQHQSLTYVNLGTAGFSSTGWRVEIFRAVAVIPYVRVGLGAGMVNKYWTRDTFAYRQRVDGLWEDVTGKIAPDILFPLAVCIPLVGSVGIGGLFESVSLNATFSPTVFAKSGPLIRGTNTYDRLLDVNLCYTPGGFISARAGYLKAWRPQWEDQVSTGRGYKYSRFYIGVEAGLGYWLAEGLDKVILDDVGQRFESRTYSDGSNESRSYAVRGARKVPLSQSEIDQVMRRYVLFYVPMLVRLFAPSRE